MTSVWTDFDRNIFYVQKREFDWIEHYWSGTTKEMWYKSVQSVLTDRVKLLWIGFTFSSSYFCSTQKNWNWFEWPVFYSWWKKIFCRINVFKQEINHYWFVLSVNRSDSVSSIIGTTVTHVQTLVRNPCSRRQWWTMNILYLPILSLHENQ